jgi:hypothetical protein
MTSRHAIVWAGLGLALIAGHSACTASATGGSNLRPANQQGTGTYPGPCSPLGFEVKEMAAPSLGAGVPNLGEDSLLIVGTIRPGERPESPADAVGFQEQREREDDLQSQLVQRTVNACGPESSGGDASAR